MLFSGFLFIHDAVVSTVQFDDGMSLFWPNTRGFAKGEPFAGGCKGVELPFFKRIFSDFQVAQVYD